MTSASSPTLSRAFVTRRLHSLMGIWLVLFLMEHLIVNSQAALLIGDDGMGFVRGVQSIRDLPYLPVIEIVLLAFPFLIHAVWGIHYAMTSKSNSFASDGSTPSLTDYPRNRAYTWQRITSWILLVAIAAHVIHMRFIEYPTTVQRDSQEYYVVRISDDLGLRTLAARLGVQLYDSAKIQEQKNLLPLKPSTNPLESSAGSQLKEQSALQEQHWVNALERRPLDAHQLVAVSKSFGMAELLMVRNTFKNPWMILLYTLFVGFACFHAFNGLWTSFIRWGITLSEYSQDLMRKVSWFLMLLIGFLGLAAIWGTYWINLKH